MLSVKIQCPAKINLTLKVLGKRSDGFHDIESVMQTISLYDYLTMSVEPSDILQIELSGNSNEIPYNEKNLVYKAAKLFCDELKTSSKISIYIEKNIPVAAGLAGGSTDAAGTLFGLNEIFERPFNQKKLHEMCAKLGSDLNVCLMGGRVLSKGRGEIVEQLEFEPFNLSLIKPENLGISAKEAYQKFAQKEKNNERNQYVNDLEWAIIGDYKDLQEIKSKYPSAIMSGSGSTYYIINDTFQNQKGYWISNNLFAVEFGVAVYNH